MDHVAIMKKSWNLLDKILSGEKKIESRWYKTRRSPWNRINIGDNIYFKNSGEPVNISSKVKKVVQVSDLTYPKIDNILMKYGKDICIDKTWKDKLKGKKYCILIFLYNVNNTEPFEISKKGFGSMASWITIDNIERLRI